MFTLTENKNNKKSINVFYFMPIKYIDKQTKGDEKMKTFKVEIEGLDGVKRVYSLSLDEFTKIISSGINYRLVL